MRRCWRGRCAGVRRLISCMRRRARRVRSANPRRALGTCVAQALDQPREHAHGIPEQGAVRRANGCPSPPRWCRRGAGAPSSRPSADRRLDHGVVEGAHRGGRQATEGAVERVVLGHGLAVEGREAPQRVAVGDALAQFAQIPGLDPLEHEGAEDLGGAQARRAPCRGRLSPRTRSWWTSVTSSSCASRKSARACRVALKRDALDLQFEIGEAEGRRPRPHGARSTPLRDQERAAGPPTSRGSAP